MAITERFIRADPEHGKRGQAMVAALLDCVHEDVALGAINDPRPRDVAVVEGDDDLLLLEVKQKQVTEETAEQLAEEAAAVGTDKVALVAISKRQPPLDREGVRRRANERHGVVAVIYESVWEFFAQVAVHAPKSATEIAREFPEKFLARMQETSKYRRTTLVGRALRLAAELAVAYVLTAAATRSATVPGSSCSHALITTHPAASSVLLFRWSRTRFRSSFACQ